MKATSVLLISLLSAWAGAAATPASPLLATRADKWCRLHDDVTPPGHCRTCASTTCKSIKNIARTDRFGVRCRMFGDYANNNNVWDWVPGWGCYVSASITDPTCEDGIKCCNTACNGLAGPP